MGWSHFLSMLEPLLQWITGGVAIIGAIVIVWTIYEQWTTNPEGFTWIEAILRTLGIGLLALAVTRVRNIVGAITPESYGRAPDLSELLATPYAWLTGGIVVLGAIAVLWIFYERWMRRPDRVSWHEAIYVAIGIGIIALIGSRAVLIIRAILQ